MKSLWTLTSNICHHASGSFWCSSSARAQKKQIAFQNNKGSVQHVLCSIKFMAPALATRISSLPSRSISACTTALCAWRTSAMVTSISVLCTASRIARFTSSSAVRAAPRVFTAGRSPPRSRRDAPGRLCRCTLGYRIVAAGRWLARIYTAVQFCGNVLIGCAEGRTPSRYDASLQVHCWLPSLACLVGKSGRGGY